MGITSITTPGCSIILDTCSLIYLTRLDLLEDTGRCFPIIVPGPVLREFQQKVPRKGFASLWTRLQVSGHLVVRESTPGDSPNLQGGEQACLEIYLELSSERPEIPMVIVTDDGQACRAFRARRLPFLNTPLLICALARQRVLAADQAGTAIRRVLDMGRYSEEVIKTVSDYFEEINGDPLFTGSD